MISIQDVGKEILTGCPRKFYVFAGSEFGIKYRYIEMLKNHYGNQEEYPAVLDVLNMMTTKRLIPLKPTVYVVRYDEEFVSALDEHMSQKISKANIVGTVVCLYEQQKHVTKLSKFLPDYTVSVDTVNSQFVRKYLQQDFPGLADNFINIAIDASKSYGQAKNICRSMSMIPSTELYKVPKSELVRLLGYIDVSSDAQIKAGIASRNFKYLLDVAEKYQDDEDRILYAILSTMVEMDKLLDNTYAQSDLRQYVKQWSREDIYYMFMNTYQELKKLRSLSASDPMNSVIYLFGLLQFSKIPSPEVMK